MDGVHSILAVVSRSTIADVRFIKNERFLWMVTHNSFLAQKEKIMDGVSDPCCVVNNLKRKWAWRFKKTMMPSIIGQPTFRSQQFEEEMGLEVHVVYDA
eukprot:6492152-Amphidinium_carterae.3